VRVQPLSRQQYRPIGLVAPDAAWVTGEWPGSSWEDVPKGAKLYVLRKSHLFKVVQGGEGRIRLWRGKVTGFELRGHRICNLRGAVAGEEPFEILREWAEWIRANGANVGSPAGSGYSLWRSTLPNDFVTWGDVPAPGSYMTGGRQGEIERNACYEDCDLWDISSAYAHALGTLKVPTVWRHHARGPKDVTDEDSGYARAGIYVPPMVWGPLPFRERGYNSFPTDGVFTGTFSFDELRAASAAGCDYTILDAWTARSHRMSFLPWWEIVKAGRAELSPEAAVLVKLSANSLWGRFMSEGVAEWWRFQGHELIVEEEKYHAQPTAPALSGLVSARIRARLFTEALNAVPVISCHTDGVITPRGEHITPNTGAPGRWRIKDQARTLDMISAQSFRFTRVDGSVEYHVAGIHDPIARERYFRQAITGFRSDKAWEVPDATPIHFPLRKAQSPPVTTRLREGSAPLTF